MPVRSGLRRRRHNHESSRSETIPPSEATKSRSAAIRSSAPAIRNSAVDLPVTGFSAAWRALSAVYWRPITRLASTTKSFHMQAVITITTVSPGCGLRHPQRTRRRCAPWLASGATVACNCLARFGMTTLGVGLPSALFALESMPGHPRSANAGDVIVASAPETTSDPRPAERAPDRDGRTRWATRRWRMAGEHHELVRSTSFLRAVGVWAPGAHAPADR